MKKQKVNINAKKILTDYRKKFEDLEEHKKQQFAAYLYVIFSLVTLSFFGVFAIKPTLATISDLNQQYDNNQILYNELLKKSTALRQLEAQYAQLTPDLPIIYAAVPRSTLMAYLTRQIETMAASNGLSLVQLTFGTVELYPADKDNPPLYSFTFTAVLEGNDEGVKNFIQQVIQFDRLVNIEQLNTGNRETGAYGASVTGRIYFSKY